MKLNLKNSDFHFMTILVSSFDLYLRRSKNHKSNITVVWFKGPEVVEESSKRKKVSVSNVFTIAQFFICFVFLAGVFSLNSQNGIKQHCPMYVNY